MEQSNDADKSPALSTPRARKALDFLQRWKPFGELSAESLLRRDIMNFLAAADNAQRKEVFKRASSQFRLYDLYTGLGLYRSGTNERAARYQELLELTAEKLGTLVEESNQKDVLDLIQFGFEFGRYQNKPRTMMLRRFLFDLFSLKAGDPQGMKYSLFPGKLLYSGQGKTHDEMARDFAGLGMGKAFPLAGGTFHRDGTLEFRYNVGSRAFGRNCEPSEVREALVTALRSTGGDAERLTVKLEG
ncbi:MAG: hypothetical protein OEZ59_04495 [Deltaproteobacteria bacterium]|nr:hypothetical protein [Deltaproteobacteria bacterium]